MERYVWNYTPSIFPHAVLMKQIFCKVPKELQYVKRNVFLNK